MDDDVEMEGFEEAIPFTIKGEFRSFYGRK